MFTPRKFRLYGIPFLVALFTVNTPKYMVQIVLSRVVAWGTKVKVVTSGTLPPDPWNVPLAARVTHDMKMKVA